MGRVKVSSVVIALLAASLVGFWSWVLTTPATVPDCPPRPAADAVCLAPVPVRVSTVLPVWRDELGMKVPVGPTFGMTVSGLPGGVRTVYLDEGGMDQLDPQPGQILTAFVVGGKVWRVSGVNGAAWAGGHSPGHRYGWIGGTEAFALVLALMARLDRRKVRAPRVWRWAERGTVFAAFGATATLAFAQDWAEMLVLTICIGLLLAVETAGQHWQANADGRADGRITSSQRRGSRHGDHLPTASRQTAVTRTAK